MQKNIRLQRAKSADGKRIYAHMKESFPREELREYEDFYKVFNEEKNYAVYFLYEGAEEVGFIAVWSFPFFAFIEHFAVYPAFRGKNYGSVALEEMKRRYSCLLLEIELPTEEIQIKRLRFYLRAGFQENGFYYEQPPYRKDGKPVPMKILSYPAPVSDAQETVSVLYSAVYAREKAR